MDVNLHQLHFFYAVARLGSFSRAADNLDVTQPAVSRQVQLLEESLGTILLKRQSRGATLTAAGQTVYQYAHRIFGLAGELQKTMRDVQGIEEGTLAVGATSTPGTTLLPGLLGRFHQRHPHIRTTLSVAMAPVIAERVAERELDLAVLGHAWQGDELTCEPYVVDPQVIVVGRNHPLAETEEATMDDLSTQQFVLRDAGSAAREAVDAAFRERGVAPTTALELSTDDAIVRAVAATHFAGVVSWLAAGAAAKAGDVSALRVDGWTCTRQWYLLTRRERSSSAAQQAFLSVLRAERPRV